MLRTLSDNEIIIEEAFRGFITIHADKVSCPIYLILDYQIFYTQTARFL